jgi:hypothetical protein
MPIRALLRFMSLLPPHGPTGLPSVTLPQNLAGAGTPRCRRCHRLRPAPLDASMSVRAPSDQPPGLPWNPSRLHYKYSTAAAPLLFPIHRRHASPPSLLSSKSRSRHCDSLFRRGLTVPLHDLERSLSTGSCRALPRPHRDATRIDAPPHPRYNLEPITTRHQPAPRCRAFAHTQRLLS